MYLKRLGYSFKYKNNELGNYIILKNKKNNIAIDTGPSPIKKFSNDYQAGALSFEFISNGEKIITNSGYHSKRNMKLNELSRSSASHNVLTIDDNSSCKFMKKNDSEIYIKDGLKITHKDIIYEKNYWKIVAEHDGYLKKYDLLYRREIEFFLEQNKLIGTEKILGKKNSKFKI